MRINIWDELIIKPLVLLGVWDNVMHVMSQLSAELSKPGDLVPGK